MKTAFVVFQAPLHLSGVAAPEVKSGHSSIKKRIAAPEFWDFGTSEALNQVREGNGLRRVCPGDQQGPEQSFDIDVTGISQQYLGASSE